MSFYRIKKIKGHEYVYYVKNKWTKKGARQKVSKYLGPLIRLEKKKDIDFEAYIKIDLEKYLDAKTPFQIIDDIICYELTNHGFKKDKSLLRLDKISFNGSKIYDNKKQLVLYLNEGYLSSLSIRNLKRFSFLGDESSTATKMAMVFVNSGLKIPEGLFIHLFKKIYQDDKVTKFY